MKDKLRSTGHRSAVTAAAPAGGAGKSGKSNAAKATIPAKAACAESSAPNEPNERTVQRLCGMLGLAKKAGALITGTDMSLEAVRSGKSDALLLASDAAPNTADRAARGCRACGAALYLLPIDKERLGDCIGRHSAVGAAALTDPNFGRVIYAMCKGIDPIVYTANKQSTTQEVE